MKFSEWPFPSRNPRLLTTFWPTEKTKFSRKKLFKSSPYKSKLKQDKEPDLNHTLLLEMERDTSDWDGNATRKSREQLRVLLKVLS